MGDMQSVQSWTDHNFPEDCYRTNRGLSPFTPYSRTQELNHMPRLTATSTLILITAGLLLLLTGTFLYVKVEAGRSAKAYDRVWSESGACYIDAYIPNYRELGVIGKTVALFSGNGFFRVYSKEGTELKSSEWLLWQRDYPDMEGAFWTNGHVFYSSADGYGGWSLPECG
jgi:hypothetical protein